MAWIANATYWMFGICFVAGLGAIGFSWEQMRRQLNQVLPSEQRVTFYPPLPQSFGELVWKTNDLGHFVAVLDQYRKIYPSSPLPKKVAIALVIWILCVMALLVSGVGR
jgi:hypothetical protein